MSSLESVSLKWRMISSCRQELGEHFLGFTPDSFNPTTSRLNGNGFTTLFHQVNSYTSVQHQRHVIQSTVTNYTTPIHTRDLQLALNGTVQLGSRNDGVTVHRRLESNLDIWKATWCCQSLANQSKRFLPTIVTFSQHKSADAFQGAHIWNNKKKHELTRYHSVSSLGVYDGIFSLYSTLDASSSISFLCFWTPSFWQTIPRIDWNMVSEVCVTLATTFCYILSTNIRHITSALSIGPGIHRAVQRGCRMRSQSLYLKIDFFSYSLLLSPKPDHHQS